MPMRNSVQLLLLLLPQWIVSHKAVLLSIAGFCVHCVFSSLSRVCVFFLLLQCVQDVSHKLRSHRLWVLCRCFILCCLMIPRSVCAQFFLFATRFASAFLCRFTLPFPVVLTSSHRTLFCTLTMHSSVLPEPLLCVCVCI